MKNIILATAATLGLMATAAAADNLDFVGSTEYAFESEVFTTEAGLEYSFSRYYISPSVTLNDATNDLDFAGAEIEFGATVTDGVVAFLRVEADGEFEYQETVIGVNYRF